MGNWVIILNLHIEEIFPEITYETVACCLPSVISYITLTGFCISYDGRQLEV
ncbi:MAG: hypothetical protein F6K41_34710 [Symploca sp. SIO3E6]|nr:hypothetical protein [Caldora sp. SIO3E6]